MLSTSGHFYLICIIVYCLLFLLPPIVFTVLRRTSLPVTVPIYTIIYCLFIN